MNMPGFTADASLSPALGNYHTRSAAGGPSDAIEPQMTKQEMNEFMRSLLGGPGGVAPPWGGGGGGGGSDPAGWGKVCEEAFCLCNGGTRSGKVVNSCTQNGQQFLEVTNKSCDCSRPGREDR